jgi:diguanylate cyclase (GGDEF)-like protein
MALACCAMLSLSAFAADPTPATRIELLRIDAPASVVPDAHVMAVPMPLTLPYSDAGSWVRITVDRAPSEPRLVVESMVSGPVTLLLPDGRRIIRSKLHPDYDEVASPVALVFPLPTNLSANAPLLLHFDHHHLAQTTVLVLSKDAALDRERQTLVLATMLYSALASFALVTACFWLIVRERIYAQYALFLLMWLTYMSTNSGLFYRLPGSSLIAALGIHGQWMILTLAIALPFSFVGEFLDLRRHAPRLLPWFARIFRAVLVAAVLIAVSPWPWAWYGLTMGVTAGLMFIGLIGIGAYIALTTHDRYAVFFLAGWVPMTLGSLLRILQAAGLIQVSMMYMYALGVLMQAAVIMMGLADRLLRVRRERDLAQQAAEHDGLTGLLNRRALEQRLRALTDESRAGGAGLAIMFLDIDHFKTINDTHGHAGGDLCLQAVAERITAELRSGDYLGRWGGEEFVALLPGSNIDDARQVSERVRTSIAENPVAFEQRTVPVTISIGIAVFDPLRDNAAALTARADAALYRAKQAGRNRVEAMAEAVAA